MIDRLFQLTYVIQIVFSYIVHKALNVRTLLLLLCIQAAIAPSSLLAHKLLRLCVKSWLEGAIFGLIVKLA